MVNFNHRFSDKTNINKVYQIELNFIWTYVIWLSELLWTMCELAELLEWAGSSVHEVLAHLSLELLLESVDLALVTEEAIVVLIVG